MKIDKNVPLPDGPANPKYLSVLSDMEIGDSVLVRKCDGDPDMFYRAAKYNEEKLHAKFCSRAEGDGKRIWRVE